MSDSVENFPSYFSVILFAGLRDAMKSDRLGVVVPAGDGKSTLTVTDLLQACAAQFPLIVEWLPHVRVAVNCEYALPHTRIAAGDEIAFIPPVAGG